MTIDPPETLWVFPSKVFNRGDNPEGEVAVEYRRADRIMEYPQVKALVDALLECQAELDAYSRQEYPLDHPVHERYRKRDFDANPARIAIAQLKEPK